VFNNSISTVDRLCYVCCHEYIIIKGKYPCDYLVQYDVYLTLMFISNVETKNLLKPVHIIQLLLLARTKRISVYGLLTHVFGL
jgi:hypothetical protein